MKKSKDYTLLALAIPFLIAVIGEYGCSSESKIKDYTEIISGNDTVIITGNFNVDLSQVKFSKGINDIHKKVFRIYLERDTCTMRDYQLETFNNCTVVYDGQRKVGVIPYNKNSQLDSLINEDNQ